MKKIDNALFEGLYHKNTVLISGLIAAPVIVCAYTMKMGIVAMLAFSLITFAAVTAASFIPKRIVYTLRIILYTIIAAIVYVPVYMLCDFIFPDETAAFGIYLPLLAVNTIIVTQGETSYFKLPLKDMLIKLLVYILGFDIVVFFMSIFREIIAFGTIFGNIVGVSRTIDSLSKPFGGFILLGLAAAVLRYIIRISENWKGKEQD